MQALDVSSAKLAANLMAPIAAGQGASVLAQARRLVSRAPGAPDAHHLLALCAAQAGEHNEANRSFSRALSLAPAHPVISANFARFLRSTGAVSQAVGCWRDVLERSPNDVVALTELGLLLLELSAGSSSDEGHDEDARSQLAEAAKLLQIAVRLSPGAVRAWHALGCVLREQGGLVDARQAFSRGLEVEPTSVSLWANLAGVLRLQGEPEAALAAYAQARGVGPLPPSVLDGEVGALIDCLRIDEAHAAARSLIDQHPQYAPAYTTLSHLNREYGLAPGEEGAPEDAHRRAADRQPRNTQLQLALIRFLIESKQGAEAAERLSVLRRESNDPQLVALQARAYGVAGDIDSAERLFFEADAVLGGQDVAFCNALIGHLLKSGSWSDAAVRAERAVEMRPYCQESWAYLATAWRLLNDSREEWLCGYDRLASLMPVEAPTGWATIEDFLFELRESLEPLHKARTHPLTQSLRGGSQSPGRLFGRPDDRISALQQTLLRTVERWLETLPRDSQHPFLGRAQRSVRFTGSWSVKLWQSGSHANHFHSDGWMSSAFYVSLPPSVAHQVEVGEAHSNGPAGCLQLGQPPEELGLDLAPRRVIRPRVGHLALFPSYLWHGTVPFNDAEPRITVAFDMLPRD
jgi:Flp pilus assembly protein TadD